MPVSDRFGRTNRAGLLVAGDAAGLGTAEEALMEGSLAGRAAAAAGRVREAELQRVWERHVAAMAGPDRMKRGMTPVRAQPYR